MLVGCCDKTWCIGFAADFLVVTPQPMKKNSGSMIIDKGSHISVTGQQQIMGLSLRVISYLTRFMVT